MGRPKGLHPIVIPQWQLVWACPEAEERLEQTQKELGFYNIYSTAMFLMNTTTIRKVKSNGN
jgi:hypothetical protein